jgi:uncharacterized sulfatase
MEATVKQVDNAMRTEDYQWAAQLCDHILAITPNHQQAMLYKADALTALADKILTATARNYYISSAIQLRKKSQKISLSQEP